MQEERGLFWTRGEISLESTAPYFSRVKIMPVKNPIESIYYLFKHRAGQYVDMMSRVIVI